MHLDAARSILSAYRTPGERYGYRDEGLIWAEHGDEVDQWNDVAQDQGWGEITVRIEDDGTQNSFFYYSYKGVEMLCPSEGEREDNLRSVLAIAGLVRQDALLYACNDHVGNSEQAFLALSAQQWTALEAEFGKDAMVHCFTRAEGSHDEFCDKYFTDKNLHRERPPQREADIAVPQAQQALPPSPAPREHPAAEPESGRNTPSFLSKYWLPVGFIGFLLAVLIFGK